MGKYKNDLLGQSKEEIKKVWFSTWERIKSLDHFKDVDELVELNKKFDKCVEAMYAVDCGDYWKVQTASRVNGKHRGYKVKKNIC